VALGFQVLDGAVSNGLAVVVSAEDPPRAYSIQNLSGAPQVRPLTISPTRASRVFLNPSGTLALLYSPDTQQFQFAGGLDQPPDAPHLHHSFDGSMLRGAFVAAALANATPCALIASDDGTTSYIQEICATITSTPIIVATFPATHISSVAWFHQDADAIAADQTGNRILLISGIGNGSPPVQLAGSEQGIQAPSALLSLDDTHIAVIGSETSTLLVFDATNPANPRTVALPAAPTRLELMDSSGILALTGTGAGPVLLVDARQGFAPFFIPIPLSVPAN
jgi:hypothetical protein